MTGCTTWCPNGTPSNALGGQWLIISSTTSSQSSTFCLEGSITSGCLLKMTWAFHHPLSPPCLEPKRKKVCASTLTASNTTLSLRWKLVSNKMIQRYKKTSVKVTDIVNNATFQHSTLPCSVACCTVHSTCLDKTIKFLKKVHSGNLVLHFHKDESLKRKKRKGKMKE